jgi:hypothetical protein
MDDASGGGPELSQGATAVPDEELERLRRERFRQRVGRVLAVMQSERIDWRGVPHVTPDGRIGVRIIPVEGAEP